MLRRILFPVFLIFILWAVTHPPIEERPAAAGAQAPASRAQFAASIEELSEPEGYFDTDNFISNETSYLHVIGDLRKLPSGGVYLGVGPDQNFSYIVHTQPALAIVIDIRRQNMLQHLLYKALFEQSATRAEFLSRLFSRETPRIDGRVPLKELLAAIRRSPTSQARYQSNFASVRELLLKTMALKLSDDDMQKIEYVYRTLHEEGLDLRFSSIGRNNAANYPTFESLMLETDRSGNPQGYLATEDLFARIRSFQMENRLIPVVGNFSGPKAFKATAAFLKRNDLEVRTFYTSNVEFYLFGTAQWPRYLENVRALPMAREAVFIRAYFGNSGTHPQNLPGHRSTTLVQSVADFLEQEAAGRFRSYQDIVF